MKRIHFRRPLWAFLALLLGASLAAPVFASAAGAQTEDSGYIEICKVFTPPTPPLPTTSSVAATPSFTFTISHGETNVATVTVQAGPAGTAGCSGEIEVPSGTDTITETQASWFQVTSITELPGQTYLGTTNDTAGTAVVSVAAGANVEEVTYTNALVTGYLEVCKLAASTSGLTGTYMFNVSGDDGFTTTTPLSVNVGNCSQPLEVPAGPATITEAGTNLYVTGITANFNGTGSALVGTPDLTTGTATVTIAAAANASSQTDVTYTNDVVSLKICKVWGAGTEPGGSSTKFPFTVTPASASVAGPDAGFTTSLTAGTATAPNCSAPVAYRPGTELTVSEGVVPGTKVASIANTGAESTVPAATGSVNPDTVNGTDTIIIGTPTTSTTGPTDEAIVTFTNEAAAPGQLKICKFAGTPAPMGTTFNFGVVDSVTPTVTTAVTVNLGTSSGQCVIVGEYPFNSTVTITEAASVGNAASAITTVPTFVTEDVGGVDTPTTELVQPTAATLGTTDTTSAVSVVIGEAVTTEADFTDIDPPAGSAPEKITTVSNPGVNGGTTTAISSAVAEAVSSNIAAVVANTPTITAPKALTPAEKRADLKKDDKSLANVEAAIVKAQAKVRSTKGAKHKAAEKRVTALKKEERTLKAEIKLLK